MKEKILPLIILLIFCSCNKNNDFEKKITKSDKKWYYVYGVKNIDSLKNAKFIYYTKFTKDGYWNNFYTESNSTSGSQNYYKWNYNENDSILIMGDEKEMKFKVYKFTTDTIRLKNFKNENVFFINKLH